MSVEPPCSVCPLVLVAGQLMTRQLWDPIVRLLPPGTDVRFADVSQDDSIGGMAGRLLRSMPARFDLVGFAMGGFVAFEVLRRAPERVRSVILISTLAEADTDVQRERRSGYSTMVKAGNFDAVVEQRLPILLGRRAQRDDATVATIRAMARATGAATFLRQQMAILNRVDSTSSLSAFRCPALVLRGESDAITSADHQNVMASAIAGATSLSIADCGHVIPLEAPGYVAQSIVDWLGDREQDGVAGH
ncbi:alpha/beta fold hydrolase [Parasphingopyxis lamellibrachiae]|uniref:alpha/beta fold hydrolase n=1 Tax=Parasphingopyxis lamellibrachiae TaxID=680125 RepID=UPI000E21C337|nr:alpha/beta hydrolase [Parasphingopyxis lamellibrachiae]